MRGMIKLLLVGCFTLAMLAPAAAQWTQVTPSGGRYTILMPGKAKEDTQSIALSGGLPNVTMYQALVETSNAAFLATYTDYPESAMKGLTVEKMLDNVRNGSANGHKLRSEQRITIGGHPAREYIIDRANGVVLVTRSTIVSNRLYQIIVAGSAGIENGGDTRKFLESFALR